MMKFIDHKKIDKKKWDDCISQSSYPSVFAYSWYLDVVSESWGGLVKDDYEAVFPLAHKTKYGIEVIYQPFFTRYYGSFSKGNTGPVLEDLINSIPASFRHVETAIYNPVLKDIQGIQIKERKFQALALDKDYRELYADYSDNTKRNLKKAVKAELEIKPGIKPTEIVDLFKKTKGLEIKDFNKKSFAILLELMNECSARDCGESYAAYDPEGGLVCGAYFIKSGQRLTYLKSGLTEKGRNSGAMHLIMDHVIKKYSGTKFTLDFGGSSVESIARFYKNFGAKDCLYLQVKRDKLPAIVKWIKKIKAK